MDIKNLKISNKAKALALAGLIATTPLLSGCNYTMIDTKYNYNKAIILSREIKRATIVSVKKWKDYDGEQLQIITESGMPMITSSFDTKLINDEFESAEEVAKALLGEDVEISYLGQQQKQKTR